MKLSAYSNRTSFSYDTASSSSYFSKNSEGTSTAGPEISRYTKISQKASS